MNTTIKDVDESHDMQLTVIGLRRSGRQKFHRNYGKVLNSEYYSRWDLVTRVSGKNRHQTGNVMSLRRKLWCMQCVIFVVTGVIIACVWPESYARKGDEYIFQLS